MSDMVDEGNIKELVSVLDEALRRVLNVTETNDASVTVRFAGRRQNLLRFPDQRRA